jgi:hypothetical protein
VAIAALVGCASKSSTSNQDEGAEQPSGADSGPVAVPVVEPGQLSRLVVNERNGCVSADDQRVLCWGLDLPRDESPKTPAGERVAQVLDLGQGSAKIVDLSLGHRRVCAAFDDGMRRCRDFQHPEQELPVEPLPADFVNMSIWDADSYQPHANQCVLAGKQLRCNDDVLEDVADYDTHSSFLACALLSGGVVTCWNGHDRRLKARERGTIEDARSVIVGTNACALTHAGALWCEGEIRGLLDQNDWNRSFERIAEAGVVAVDRSQSHLCAIMEGGAVWCAGRNDRAQLGVGDSEPRERKVDVKLPGPAREVAVSSTHSCAIVDRSVLCWGTHGNWYIDSSAFPRETSRLDIEATALHLWDPIGCAQVGETELRCWGDRFNLDGIVRTSTPRTEIAVRAPIDRLLGNRLLSNGELWVGEVISAPEAAPGPEPTVVHKHIAELFSASLCDCTIDRGGVFRCWDGITNSGRARPLSGIRRRGHVTHASITTWEACVVADGRVECAYYEPETKDEEGWIPVDGLSGVTQVTHVMQSHLAVQPYTSIYPCARTQAGGIRCVSYDENNSASVFALVDEHGAEIGDAEAIVGGKFGVCARSSAGAVRCGSATKEQPTMTTAIESGAVELAAAESFWCARVDENRDGTSEAVVCSGFNYDGQLGKLPGNVMLEPTPITLPGRSGRSTTL